MNLGRVYKEIKTTGYFLLFFCFKAFWEERFGWLSISGCFAVELSICSGI